MIGELARYRVSDGSSVLVALGADEGVVPTGRMDRAAREVAGSLTGALETIRTAADDALRCVREMSSSPTRIEIQFGVCLTGEVAAVIASASAGAQMTVTVVWERPD